MRRGALPGKIAVCVLALAVVLAFSVGPALAEDPEPDPAPSPDTAPDPDPEPPSPFSVTGVVVAYDIPGVVSDLPEEDEDEPEDDEDEPDEDEEAGDLDEDEDEPDEDEEDEDLDEDESEPDEDEDESESDEDEDESEPDEDEDEIEPDEDEDEIDGPFITIVNESGEYTYAVAEDVVIEAPVNEDGDYVVNEGDLAHVSGLGDTADHIVVTPAPHTGDGRHAHAAVPGVVEAVGPTGIVVRARDGFSYSFVITEATAVYAGPDTLSVSDVMVGDRVVVKGDGLGGAKWIRFTGKSSKEVRGLADNGDGRGPNGPGGDGSDGSRGRGHGKGGGRGHGGGRGRHHGHGHGREAQ